MQVKHKVVANCESPKCYACDFVKVDHQPNKIHKTKKNTINE